MSENGQPHFHLLRIEHQAHSCLYKSVGSCVVYGINDTIWWVGTEQGLADIVPKNGYMFVEDSLLANYGTLGLLEHVPLSDLGFRNLRDTSFEVCL